jgi:peptide chain release factor 1
MVVPEESEWKINEKEIMIFTTKDSGPGGQHRNKTESCVIMRHLPTGIEAKASSKSQHQNKRTAREMLETRVKRHYDNLKYDAINKQRAEDRGSGMRGDKVRTYRERDDIVTDHRNDVKQRLKDVRSGKLESLWIQ